MAKLSLAIALLALTLAIAALVQSSNFVTSVGLALPNGVFAVSGSTITSACTLTGTVKNQNADTVLAGPSSGAAGAPGFRALALSDFPADVSYVQAFGAKCDGTTMTPPLCKTPMSTARAVSRSLRGPALSEPALPCNINS